MSNIRIILVFPVIAAALFWGCLKHETAGHRGRVEVVMSASVNATRAAVIPVNNLPPRQLVIGIVTSDYPLDPSVVPPGPVDWGLETYLDRGYFGGPGLNAATVTTGEIKYTNADGTALQQVFYDQTGEYYIIRIVYPYAYQCNGLDTQADLLVSSTGSYVIFDVDGSQDVMSSNMGYGNIDSPNGMVTPLNFNHHLVKLDLDLIAETADAATMFGDILSIELVDQPSRLSLDITYDEIGADADFVSRYRLVDFPYPSAPAGTPAQLTTVSESCGYVMALPAKSYTFRITTRNRLSFYVDALFSSGARAGYAYPITLKFMASDEVILYAGEAEEWWIDQTFK